MNINKEMKKEFEKKDTPCTYHSFMHCGDIEKAKELAEKYNKRFEK